MLFPPCQPACPHPQRSRYTSIPSARTVSTWTGDPTWTHQKSLCHCHLVDLSSCRRWPRSCWYASGTNRCNRRRRRWPTPGDWNPIAELEENHSGHYPMRSLDGPLKLALIHALIQLLDSTSFIQCDVGTASNWCPQSDKLPWQPYLTSA